MNLIIVLFIKLLDSFLKLLKRGTSLPGLIAFKLNPNILKYFKLPKKTIFVTATNGKTTTTNLIASCLTENGKKVVTNSKGANIETGIISLLIRNSSITGKIKADYLVVEIDEQTIPSVFKKITPTVLVINNFFRDQLDRFGEIDTLLDSIKKSISSKTEVIANGNDPLVVKMLKDIKNKNYYIMDKTKYSLSENSQIRECKFCPQCNKKLNYNFYHYAQIGEFSCECGFNVPEAKWVGSNLDLEKMIFTVNGKLIKSKYEAIYNYFNILPAFATLDYFNQVNSNTLSTISNFELNDGRTEIYYINSKKIILNLVKNPVGLNENINLLEQKRIKKFSLLFILNNFAADSKDTGWIYDGDFEKLSRLEINKLIASGKRAYDLANRAIYADIEKSNIEVIENLDSAIEKFINQLENEDGYIFSTYTPLQKTRKKLKELQDGRN
jgi:UDP-N-acetylmuramyl tripeptide synthase